MTSGGVMAAAALLAAAVCASLAAPARVSDDGVITVHLVPHTHDDTGWLKTVDQYYSGENNTIQRAAVRSILDAVVEELRVNPNRTFTWVEQAFFQMWWREQKDVTRDAVRQLVKNGQLTFVNGGWCMHDEADTHYTGMIDQTTLGHRYLREQFGPVGGVPTVAWQLDPFGHSATQAALLSYEAGMDSLFFGRIDYQDLALRIEERRAEFVWRASPSLGPDAEVFTALTGSYSGNYGPPKGFNWHISVNDPFIEDNEDLSTYNVPSRLRDFYEAAGRQANQTRGRHILWTMGSDFYYENAETWYNNMDALVRIVNNDSKGFRVTYSTPARYAAAKRAEAEQGDVTWPVTQYADFFPYADNPHMFWTGYFTSRPNLKRYIRMCSSDFASFRQAQALASAAPGSGGGGAAFAGDKQRLLEEALAIAQHHDAVTGTSKQHVAFDYQKRLAAGRAAAEPVFLGALEALVGGGGGGGAAAAGAGLWATCPLLNVSVCPATTGVAVAGGSVTVVVWNALAQNRTEVVRLPLPQGATSASVRDVLTGRAVAADVVSGETVVDDYNSSVGTASVVAFYASAPALGAASYEVTVGDADGATAAARVVRSVSDPAVDRHRRGLSSPAQRQASKDAPRPPPAKPARRLRSDATPDAVTIENTHVALIFSRASGTLVRWRDKDNNVTLDVNQTFCFYQSSQGDRESRQSSGAYIFRPASETCVPVHLQGNRTAPVITSVHEGGVMSEVRQEFSGWLTQTVRLGRLDRFATFEHTVGPVPKILDPFHPPTAADACVSWRGTKNCKPHGSPNATADLPCGASVPEGASGFCECVHGRVVSREGCGHVTFTCKDRCVITGGKEVLSRFTAAIASRGELVTDANGREALVRRRDHRPTWPLNQTEPIAGNYYPVNSVAAIRDEHAQLTVLVDAAQGAASVRDGELEIMVQRRLFVDDDRGVAEPLDETEFTAPYWGVGKGEHTGRGIVTRGRHVVLVHAPWSAAAEWRPLADRVFAAPTLAFLSHGGGGAGGAGKIVTRQQPGRGLASDGKSVVGSHHDSTMLRRPVVSALAAPLPPNLQIITLQSLSEREVLLRLAHQFGVDEDAALSKPVSVDLARLFDAAVMPVASAREVTLTANRNKTALVESRRRAARWAPLPSATTAAAAATLGRSRNGGGSGHQSEAQTAHWWRQLPPLDWAANTTVVLGPLEIKTFVLSLAASSSPSEKRGSNSAR